MKLYNILALLTLLGLSYHSFSQVSQNIPPLSFDSTIRNTNEDEITSHENINIFQMPSIPQNIIDSLISINDTTFIHRYGIPIDTTLNLKELATIDNIDYGDLYRLTIIADSSLNLSCIFSNFQIPFGATLHIYNKDSGYIIGAFTSNNNDTSLYFPTMPLRGNLITLEYFEPIGSEFSGTLIVGTLIHGFLDLRFSASHFGRGPECAIDINCEEGDAWQLQKKSIVKILVDGTSSTGALLNNENNDGEPYILAALHSFQGENTFNQPVTKPKWAKMAIFFFNFESPECDGDVGSDKFTITGSEIISSNELTDFVLLKLKSKPLSYFNVYFSGWDRTSNSPQSGANISHPAGDVKKIALYSSSASPYLAQPKCNKPFNVETWSVVFSAGISGRGSSGSPLFNQNKLVVGQLHSEICNNRLSCNNLTGPATFGRFDKSWNNSSANNSLAHWLSPNLNHGMLSGKPACGENVFENHNLSHTIINDEYWRARNNILTSNTIESGNSVYYEFGNEFQMTASFEAKLGSSFEIAVGNNDCILACNFVSFLSPYILTVSNSGSLCYHVHNAREFNIKVHNLAGSEMHSNSGNVLSNIICAWENISVSPGVYIVKVEFKNDCHSMSRSYRITVQ